MIKNELLKLKISLKKDTLNGKILYDKLLCNLWFKPLKIYLAGKTRGQQSFKKKHLEQVRKLDSEISIALNGKFERFSFTKPAHRNTHQSIDIEFLKENYDIVLRLLEDVIFNNEHFIVAYCCSEDDFFRQTTSIPSHYEVRGIPLPENLFIYKDNAGWDRIDVSDNPGRINLVSNMWLTSTWQMWFGKSFYKYVEKNKLQSFEEACKLLELNNEITFIELYESPFEASTPSNRQKQSNFREHIKMEDLIIKLK